MNCLFYFLPHNFNINQCNYIYFILFYSMLCIQEELGNLKDKEPVKDNAVGINKLESDVLKPSGWFDGLLGCLKPMLGIMGKGNSHDLKSYQGNYIIFHQN